MPKQKDLIEGCLKYFRQYPDKLDLFNNNNFDVGLVFGSDGSVQNYWFGSQVVRCLFYDYEKYLFLQAFLSNNLEGKPYFDFLDIDVSEKITSQEVVIKNESELKQFFLQKGWLDLESEFVSNVDAFKLGQYAKQLLDSPKKLNELLYKELNDCLFNNKLHYQEIYEHINELYNFYTLEFKLK